MMYRNIRILLILIVTNSVLYSSAQLLVKGSIYDPNKNKVFIFEPINGFYNETIYNQNSLVKLNENGHFKHQIDLTQPNMICMRIGLTPIRFYAEPGDTIEMHINLNKFSLSSPNGGIDFKGENSVGNEYFNLFNFLPGKKYADYEYIADDSLHFRQNKNFKSIGKAIKRVSYYFDTLLQEKQITIDFYNAVVPGIKGILVTSEIRYLLVEQNSIPFNNAVKQAIEIYERYPVTNNMIKKSPFGSSIAYYYYKTMAARFYHGMHMGDSTLIVNNKRVTVDRSFVYWLYAPNDIQEIFWPISLIGLKKLFSTKFGKEDVEAFLSLHPGSPVRKPLISFFKNYDYVTNGKVDSALIISIPDSNITSLSQLIRLKFSGSRVFIDLWASWCAPCKQEFQFAKRLDSFCRKYNIRKLYISIDEPEMKSVMLQVIYAYNLKGYHIRASKKLYEDLKKSFYTGKEIYFTIPRYLLINESGIIVSSNTPRPSSGNKLFNVMKRKFKIKE